MNIEFKNVFLAGLQFGKTISPELILAKDQEEAIKAINDYYAEPEIVAISSLEEMIAIVQMFSEKKDLILINELIMEDDGSLTMQASEAFGDILEEKNKMDDRQAILFNEDSALFTVLNNLYYIKHANLFPIIGESYEK